MTPSVSSHGYSSANIFFLSGFPSSEDLRNGIALSGSSESTLNSFLHPHHLTVKNTYRSCFIKEKLEYSGHNRKKLLKALKKVDTIGYENLLFSELKDINPNVIVPLDDIALSAVFPQINKMSLPRGRKQWLYCYRGSVLKLREDWQASLNSKFIRVIPTFGPRQLIIDNTAKCFVELDYNRIISNKEKSSPVEEYGMRWVCRVNNDLVSFIERSFAKNPIFLNFDIETYGSSPTCISFSFDGFEGVSVPLSDKLLSNSELILIWRTVAKLLAHTIPKGNQNIKYDLLILERFGFVINNILYDPMLLLHLLYPELPKGLDFSTSIYTDIAYYKDEGRDFDIKRHSKDRLYLYNAQDSIASHKVVQEELKELDENPNLKSLYYNEIVPLIIIYRDMEKVGILVDQTIKERLNIKYTLLFESNLKVLRTLVGKENFNPLSNPQVGELLYEELKFPKRTKTLESGEVHFKADKDTLDDLSINHAENNKEGKIGYNILLRIIMCRKLGKVIEYINTPLSINGRFCSSSNLAGTDSGRSSFSKTIDEIWSEKRKKLIRIGRSLQTITKHGFSFNDEVFDDFESTKIASDVRSMFVPDNGYIFVECDGNSAEAREVAVLAEDYELLSSFDTKPRVHAKTAAAIFGIDVSLITKDSPTIPKIGMAYYDLGKRARHAKNYAMGPFRLSQMSHIPLAECKTILNKISELNPQIESIYHAQIYEAIRKNRRLVTPFGRQRDFFGKLDDHLYKSALSYIPQSTISDHTKFSMPRIKNEFNDVIYLTEQHDGFLAEVKQEKWEEYAKICKKVYERTINHEKCTLSRNFELRILCEISISKENWMELKEIEI